MCACVCMCVCTYECVYVRMDRCVSIRLYVYAKSAAKRSLNVYLPNQAGTSDTSVRVPKSQREIRALDIVKIAGTQARTRQGTDDNR